MALPSIFRGLPVGVIQESANPLWSNRSAERLLEDLWRGAGQPEGFSPRIDVVESEAEYLVTAEVPGLDEKDLQIEVHGDVLTLSGEKRAEHEGERKGWRWSERSFGSFRRAIRLPVEVEADKASASFKNGVLTVTLPKAAAARVRQITVNPA